MTTPTAVVEQRVTGDPVQLLRHERNRAVRQVGAEVLTKSARPEESGSSGPSRDCIGLLTPADEHILREVYRRFPELRPVVVGLAASQESLVWLSKWTESRSMTQTETQVQVSMLGREWPPMSAGVVDPEGEIITREFAANDPTEALMREAEAGFDALLAMAHRTRR